MAPSTIIITRVKRSKAMDDRFTWTLYDVQNHYVVASGLSLPEGETIDTDYAILFTLVEYDFVDADTSLQDLSLLYDDDIIYVDDELGNPICELTRD